VQQEAAEVPVRVAGGHDRHRVVGGPCEPEEVALVARPVGGQVAGERLLALRVVREQVEEAVQLEEAGAQVRARAVQVLCRRAEIADVGPGRADERADPVADDRHRLLREGPDGAVCRQQLAGGRAQRLERGPGHLAELVHLAQRPFGLRERGREPRDGE
jgi:hypothetical protein